MSMGMIRRHEQFLKNYNIIRQIGHYYDTDTIHIWHGYGTPDEVSMHQVFIFYNPICFLKFQHYFWFEWSGRGWKENLLYGWDQLEWRKGIGWDSFSSLTHQFVSFQFGRKWREKKESFIWVGPILSSFLSLSSPLLSPPSFLFFKHTVNSEPL